MTDDQKYGMIEAIAHLINRDYSLIGEDFKNMVNPHPSPLTLTLTPNPDPNP